MFEILIFGLALLILQVVVFFLGLLAAGVAALKRKWWLALAFVVPSLLCLPGTVFVLSVAQTYRVPSWGEPIQVEGRYVGAHAAVTFSADGRYRFDSGEQGSWRLVPNTEETFSSLAGTLVLSPEAGEPLELAVRWDDAIGYQGELLRLD